MTADTPQPEAAPAPWHVRALEALPVGVAWLEQTRFAWMNDAFCRLVGRSREVLLGRIGFDILAPGEVERVRTRHEARARGEQAPETYEVDFARGDGSTVRLELSPRVVPGGDTLLVVRSLGERIRDLALLRALGQLAATVQRAPSVEAVARAAVEGIWALGMGGAVMRVEEGTAIQVAVAMPDEVREVIEAVAGAPLEGLRLPVDRLPNLAAAFREHRAVFMDDAGAALRNLAGSRDHPWSEQLAAQARAAGLAQFVLTPLMVGGESWGLLVVLGNTLRSNDAAALALFGAQLGSALEAAETIENLERHNRRLEVVHRLAVLGVEAGLGPLSVQLLNELAAATRSDVASLYLADKAGQWLVLTEAVGLSDALRKAYPRVPLAEFLSAWPDRLTEAHPLPEEVLTPELRAELAAGGIRQVAVVPLRVDGRLTGLVYLSRADGEPYAEAALRDAETLVALVALQLERARLFHDLSISYEQLSRAQEELVKRERLAALGELSALVAHEVRNPLGAIVNSVANLRRLVPAAGDGTVLLDIVEEESDRLNRMVSDLLDFARPSLPQLRELPVEVLVLGALESAARGGAGTGEVTVRTQLCPAAPTIKVDAQMFRQAVVNLVTNAVQASPAGGTVTVRARRDTLRGAECVAVEVSDEGPGVPPDLADRVFQPFFTTRASGTGLGLALVRRIAEIHRAEVRVKSLPGEGATFTMLFPL